MELKSIKAFEGRNVHSHYPVVEMIVDLGPYAERMTSEFPGFDQELLACLPGLAAHTCSRGTPGGFLERVREGTLLGHVIEHVALELQEMAGIPMIYGKTRRAEKPGVYRIIFEYRARAAALAAGEDAFHLVRSLVEGRRTDGGAVAAELARIAARTELGPSTAAIVQAAQCRGIPVTRLGDDSLVQLGYGKHRRFVRATITDRTPCLGTDLAGDKTTAKRILSDGGLPVPLGGAAATEDGAVELAWGLGFPVVVKPRHGNQGKGVSLDLRGEADVRRAFQVATRHDQEVVVEQFIRGRHYRFLVISGKVEAVAERWPAMVTGDGRSTIARLVEEVNQDPDRGEEHEKRLTKIKIDPEALLALAKQGYTPEAVPAAGTAVLLRDNANLSTGGTARDVTDEVHSDNRDLVVRAVELLSLDVAGVDVVAHDIGRPLDEDGGAIIEVNAAPGLRMHLHPSEGKPRPVAGAVVDYLFPDRTNARVPICAITGTNGKTTVTRMIGFGLGQQGLCVGMTTTEGVYVGRRLVAKGDTTGPRSARVVLSDPRVDAAVLETARGGILRGGLAFDRCDVAVVTNVSWDHVGLDGVDDLEDLVHIKSLLVEAVPEGGWAVLNADDPRVLSMADRCYGSVFLFSVKGDNLTVRRHVLGGGRVLFLKRGVLTLATPEGETPLLHYRRIPCTWNGKARYNIENAMAAAGALHCLGLSVDAITACLKEFGTTPGANQGRGEIRTVAGRKVLIDYGHNTPALKALLPFIKELGARRTIGVITAPGDRPSDDIYRFGLLAGRGFTRLVVREDEDKRGRPPGETAGLLWRGARDAGLPPEAVSMVLGEKDAVRAALEMGGSEDLIVVIYEKYGKVDRVLRELDAELGAHPPAVVSAGVKGGGEE